MYIYLVNHSNILVHDAQITELDFIPPPEYTKGDYFYKALTRLKVSIKLGEIHITVGVAMNYVNIILSVARLRWD